MIQLSLTNIFQKYYHYLTSLVLQDEEYIQQVLVPQLSRHHRHQYRLCLQHRDLAQGGFLLARLGSAKIFPSYHLLNCQSAFTLKFYCFIIQQNKTKPVKYLFPLQRFIIINVR